MLAFLAMTLTLQGSSATEIQADERLKKPITVRLKVSSLRDAMATLSKESGAPLDVATNIREQKVTVLVNEMPSGLILAKIADTLGGRWTLDGAVWRLGVSSERAAQERSYLAKEDIELRRAVESQAKAIAAVTQRSYAEVLAAAQRPTSEASGNAATRLALQSAANPANYALGLLYRGWGSSEWAAFWNGDVATTVVPARTLATDAPPRRGPGGPGGPVVVLARYDAFGSAGLTQLTLAGEPAGGTAVPPFPPIPVGVPAAALKDEPFAQEIVSWGNVDEGGPPLDRAAPLTTPATPTASFANKPTLADELEVIHVQTGAPIIADAFRVTAKTPLTSLNNKAALAALRAVVAADGGSLKVADGVAMYRHAAFWRRKRQEIPEPLLRSLEKLKTPPTIGDYSALAAQLTAAQIAPFRSALPPAVAFDPRPLRFGTVLKLYGSLNGAAKEAARRGEPVPLSSLSGTSATLFNLAMYEGPFVGALVVGRGLLNDPRRLAMVVSDGEITDRTGQLLPGWKILLGSSLTDGVVFQIPQPTGAG